MSICSLCFCPSFTASILRALYPAFSQRNQWFKNCQLDDTVENNKLLYLCELHFEKMSVAGTNQLKPNAAPTIFDKVEGTRSGDKLPFIKHLNSYRCSRRTEKAEGGKHASRRITQDPAAKAKETGQRFAQFSNPAAESLRPISGKCEYFC